MIGGIYLIYLFCIVILPQWKRLCEPPNPLETGNRLLNQLRQSQQQQRTDDPHSSLLDQSYQKIDYEDPEILSPFDSRTLLTSNNKPPPQPPINPILTHLNTTIDLNDNDYNENSMTNDQGITGNINAEDNNDEEYFQHRLSLGSNYSTTMTSPDRKSFTSLYSNKSSIASLRHPMLMSEYDPDFALDDGFPSDIEEYENESYTPTTQTPRNGSSRFEDHNNIENDDGSKVNKIILITPKLQKNVNCVKNNFFLCFFYEIDDFFF